MLRPRFGKPLLSLCALVLLSSSAPAQSQGPFSDFSGNWTGSGTLASKSGKTERLRCSAIYNVGDAGNSLLQNLRCRSDSAQFEILSSLQSQQGQVSGNWTETTRNARGSVAGRINSGRIQSSVSGPGFTASVNLSAQGPRQAINIRSSGTEFSSVSMTLTRNSR